MGVPRVIHESHLRTERALSRSVQPPNDRGMKPGQKGSSHKLPLPIHLVSTEVTA